MSDNSPEKSVDNSRYILVVDDEQSIRELISHTLKADGFDVAIAGEGNTALKMIEERIPDLVILDVNMPGLNGIQVLEKIRERSDIPVIILSVLSDVDTISDALAAGADDYIGKPFDNRELIVRVKAQLGDFRKE